MEKTLVIYVEGSFYKYPGLFKDYLYGIDDKQILTVYFRDKFNAEEICVAAFRRWDYLLIQEA